MTTNSYAEESYYLHRITEALRGNPTDGISPALPISLGASEKHLGQVGGHTACKDATPTLSVAGAYVTGDYVGTTSVCMTFSDVARVANGTGIIVGAVLIDKALQSIGGELWLFDTAPTPPADNAAWTITDADALNLIGVIPFTTYYASAANSVAPVGNLTIGFQSVTKNIFGCFVTRGSPTYATGDLKFRLRVLQD